MCKYTVQFEYGGGKPHCFPIESPTDLSKGTPYDKDYVVGKIELFIESKNLHEKGKKVHDVVLWDENGDGVWGIEDLSILYPKHF